MALVTLALGSNLGDRAENLRTAHRALAADFSMRACSRVYETEPAYVYDQPRYYNQVCQAGTALPPTAALHRLKSIEAELGRVPGTRFGPRLIDLDLILPHPRLAERPFVLVPLAELAPNLVHPRLKVSVAELLARLGDTQNAVWPAQN
jgi:2-amino-4-hydroxy-6-hydroxymethyldihydropteridine diphosphokinase